MSIYDEIIMMLEGAKNIPAPVNRESNLYTDLGFDSLEFITFLVSIEDAYSIVFDLIELELCLRLDTLTALVEAKVRERDGYA